MNKIFKNDMQPVSLWEKIKLLFIKAQEDFDLENGIIVKYKKMNNTLYILEMTFVRVEGD